MRDIDYVDAASTVNNRSDDAVIAAAEALKQLIL
jgi:hypothetical protein